MLEAVGLTSKSGDLASQVSLNVVSGQVRFHLLPPGVLILLHQQMSGGQRRRLSLAVSLIGKPDIVFLDEPTTGMDPHNRQRCWKLLQGEKQSCTIMLTTHRSAHLPLHFWTTIHCGKRLLVPSC
jgi:ABC-type transporter Mla maintaining outer membrane lipid asymmetry ATPase subunit MlaF